MLSLTSPTATNLRRVGVAVVFAAATVLGTTTSTLADPATACATSSAPFERDLYLLCVAKVAGKAGMTDEEFEQAKFDCCYDNGGEVTLNEDGEMACNAPAEGPETKPAPPQGPPNQAPPGPNQPTLAPQPPPPPTGPVTPGPGLPPVQTR